MGHNADIQPRVQTIDELCEECAALIEHHDKIQLLSMVQGNLRKTLVDVENIAELPQEAAAAEELLADNTQLLQVGDSSWKTFVIQMRVGGAATPSSCRW